MAEGTQIRLVRCPKCENILQEPSNLAVYQCGGCSAVLQAQEQPTASGGYSEKSDDEKVRVCSEKLESFPEKREGEDMSDALVESDRMSNGVKLRQERRERGLPNGVAESNSSSSPRIGNKVVNENTHNQHSLEQETAPIGKYRRTAKDPVDSWVLGNDHDMNRNREKSVGVGMEKEIETGFASRSRRSGHIPNWRSGERDGVYRRTPRAVAEDVRFSGTPYTDAGPSNYQPCSYGRVEPLKNSVGPDRVEHLEQDRAELLRKLEELNLLKDQLTRSRDVPEKPKEGLSFDERAVPIDPYVGHNTWFPEGSSRQHRPSMQPFPAEKHAQRPLYSNYGLEPTPTGNRRGMDMQNFYSPLMHASNDIPSYGDPFVPQMAGPSKQLHQYQEQPSRDYFSAQYMGMDSDHNASYSTNTFFHQPACSCVHCYDKQWHTHAQVPPSVLHNRRFPDAPTNPMLYHDGGHRATFVHRGYNPRDTNLPAMHHELHPRLGRQNLDVGTSGFGQTRPRRVVPIKRSGRRCCPIAGGAPFITCHNCFELLPLPRKVLLMEKNYRKLRCGACSTVISLLIENNRIIVSVPADGVPLEGNDSPLGGVTDELLQSHGKVNGHGGADSSDYDSSGYNFHLTDTEPGSSSMERKPNLSEEKLEDLVSSCSTSSADEESPDSVIARREVSNSAEQHFKDKGTPPLPSSPLRDYTSSNQVANKFEKGNRSKRRNQEEVVPTKATSRQNSVKEAAVATEMDVSYNEYSNGAMSQEYGEVSKEDQQRVSKGGDSFFVGLIKKGFKDLSKSHHTGEHDRSNVTINGHPISEKLLKKAEKLAGPIHPGQYWYDVRAGFWGVMGQPCLGIIPPFIEEFNYPMPEHCAGGNTGVYVNGRELHQRDLDLLANRGLPTDTDKSYIIEISGRVSDEDTGEELDNLGKLAPTVEKLKHGFGMRVPRMAAA